MKTMTTVFSIVCTAALIFTGIAFADSTAIRTMADVTMNLNHFPSDSDKQKLSAISSSEDSSQSELAVATAIMNIEHHVTAADKETLNSIIGDESAPAGLRALAGILVNMNHRPSESDVAELATIVADSGR
jgi:hypothetical protein